LTDPVSCDGGEEARPWTPKHTMTNADEGGPIRSRSGGKGIRSSPTDTSEFLRVDHPQHLAPFVWVCRLPRHPAARIVVVEQFWRNGPRDPAERAAILLNEELSGCVAWVWFDDLGGPSRKRRSTHRPKVQADCRGRVSANPPTTPRRNQQPSPYPNDHDPSGTPLHRLTSDLIPFCGSRCRKR
jgi:hypothetical protein